MARKERNIYNDRRVTWAHAFRDVALRSLSRGQFLPFCVFAIIILILFRLPSDSLAELFFSILNALKNFELIAYLLFFITLFLWVLQAKWSRRQFYKEFERIGKEKSDLQNRLNRLEGRNTDFESSDN